MDCNRVTVTIQLNLLEFSANSPLFCVCDFWLFMGTINIWRFVTMQRHHRSYHSISNAQNAPPQTWGYKMHCFYRIREIHKAHKMHFRFRMIMYVITFIYIYLETRWWEMAFDTSPVMHKRISFRFGFFLSLFLYSPFTCRDRFLLTVLIVHKITSTRNSNRLAYEFMFGMWTTLISIRRELWAHNIKFDRKLKNKIWLIWILIGLFST